MSAAEAFPRKVEIVPPGLTVWVHRHRIAVAGEDSSCWTYLSEGMSRHGQAELVLTVKSAAEDDAGGLLRHPLELMKVLYERAAAGGQTTVGDYTELGSDGLFGRADLRGVCYVPAQALANGPDVSGALALLVVTADELELVRAVGIQRVAARLGQGHRYFPFPPWLDRERPSLVVAGELRQTILAGVASLWVPGAEVVMTAGTVVLSIPRAQAERARRALTGLSADAAVAFLCLAGPDASAALVWRPGQPNAQAYSSPGADTSRLAGAFCLLVPEQDADGAQLVEDGFAVTACDETWRRLRGALLSGDPLEIGGEDLGFALRWV